MVCVDRLFGDQLSFGGDSDATRKWKSCKSVFAGDYYDSMLMKLEV